jgi:hypothetical protein
MKRRLLAAIAAAASLAGCNNYNFNPVSHCLVQPASVEVRLSKVSTADILFVVDDSPSTDPKQAGLASSFGDFITRIVNSNAARAAKGLDPLDFHIAVTTSSVFMATPNGQSCMETSGAPQCCTPTACASVASCTPGTTDGCGGGQVCSTLARLDPTFNYVVGVNYQCCNMIACVPSSGCALGDPCPSLTTTFPTPITNGPVCTPGLATAGAPYAAGAFVSAASNPKVLDFDKTLAWNTWGTPTQDPRLTQLVQQFEQNIKVGSCGSGEEQHLQAARLAIQRALAGQQPGVATGAWPHPGAKLVVVWVGDEDDCSSPESAPLVMATFTPGADSCVFDKHRPAGQQREFPVSDFTDYFASLVHGSGAADLGAAFIVSAVRCADGTYAPADQCTGGLVCPVQPPSSCQPPAPVCGGAYAAGERFFQLADGIKGRGYSVVEGTVCDAYPPSTFGPVLAQIADLVQPPSSLTLPTLPATREITTVLITTPAGATRKICTQGKDWCFVDCNDRSATPACLASGTSRCIEIDHVNGDCEANPDETYSAQYIGVVPDGGCATAADCTHALGGTNADWACTIEAGASRGSCTCTKPGA